MDHRRRQRERELRQLADQIRAFWFALGFLTGVLLMALAASV